MRKASRMWYSCLLEKKPEYVCHSGSWGSHGVWHLIFHLILDPLVHLDGKGPQEGSAWSRPAQSRINTKLRPGCSELCPNRSWKPPRIDLVQPFRDTSNTESLSESEVISSGLRDMVCVSAMNPSNCFHSSCHIWHSQVWGSSSHHYFISHALMPLFLCWELWPTPSLYCTQQSSCIQLLIKADFAHWAL